MTVVDYFIMDYSRLSTQVGMRSPSCASCRRPASGPTTRSGVTAMRTTTRVWLLPRHCGARRGRTPSSWLSPTSPSPSPKLSGQHGTTATGGEAAPGRVAPPCSARTPWKPCWTPPMWSGTLTSPSGETRRRRSKRCLGEGSRRGWRQEGGSSRGRGRPSPSSPRLRIWAQRLRGGTAGPREGRAPPAGPSVRPLQRRPLGIRAPRTFSTVSHWVRQPPACFQSVNPSRIILAAAKSRKQMIIGWCWNSVQGQSGATAAKAAL